MKQEVFPRVSSPLFRLSNWLLKLKSMLTAQGKEGRKKKTKKTQTRIQPPHGNPAACMEILPPAWKFPPGRHGPVGAPAELHYSLCLTSFS